MIRTQIHLPDPLHARLKEIARERDWSLAEVIRRASELYAARYPQRDGETPTWELPEPLDLGRCLIDPADIRAEADAIAHKADS